MNFISLTTNILSLRKRSSPKGKDDTDTVSQYIMIPIIFLQLWISQKLSEEKQKNTAEEFDTYSLFFSQLCEIKQLYANNFFNIYRYYPQYSSLCVFNIFVHHKKIKYRFCVIAVNCNKSTLAWLIKIIFQ